MDTLPLRVYVRGPYDGRKTRLEVNEFERLVNSLPISAVSCEARSQAADLCRSRVLLIELIYYTSEPGSLDPASLATALSDLS
jgi:hypothetical protein